MPRYIFIVDKEDCDVGVEVGASSLRRATARCHQLMAAAYPDDTEYAILNGCRISQTTLEPVDPLLPTWLPTEWVDDGMVTPVRRKEKNGWNEPLALPKPEKNDTPFATKAKVVKGHSTKGGSWKLDLVPELFDEELIFSLCAEGEVYEYTNAASGRSPLIQTRGNDK